MEEKMMENDSLQGALQKEELVLIGLKVALALKEKKKKEAEIKIAELKVRMSKSILEVAAQAMEEFKASFEITDLNIAFGQKAFIKGFKLCKGRMVWRFPKLDLNFLEEEPDKKVGPSGATSDPSLAEVIFESFVLVAEVPEPM
ncbi:hypothetical protein COCNU_07G010700 [Cocos nucifera]|uniref:Uncharacterized protein n=1 Tax=Cocos nucifera TaxID=13894 RepID=A0A8K0IGV3_COCNU|nr:hypothetical protein COCNU_07G010700 [Cocos nucifera]